MLVLEFSHPLAFSLLSSKTIIVSLLLFQLSPFRKISNLNLYPPRNIVQTVRWNELVRDSLPRNVQWFFILDLDSWVNDNDKVLSNHRYQMFRGYYIPLLSKYLWLVKVGKVVTVWWEESPQIQCKSMKDDKQ